MTTRRKSRALTLGLGLLALLGTRASADEVVAKFVGNALQNRGGQQVQVVAVEVLANNRTMQLAIPNDKGRKAGDKPYPRKELFDVVSKLHPGSVVKVDGAVSNDLGPTLTSIEEYETKPGEDTPNGYVFSKTFEKPGRVPQTTVILTKFGKEITVVVPTHRNEKGETELDPQIMDSLGKLSEGNSVWALMQGTKLAAIEPYSDPQVGKLVKIGDTEVDGNKVPSAEVEMDGGKTVTLLVPVHASGKAFTPDVAVNAQLHKVRLNSDVSFRTHEDGDKLWLREILPAPKAPAAPPERAPRTRAPRKPKP